MNQTLIVCFNGMKWEEGKKKALKIYIYIYIYIERERERETLCSLNSLRVFYTLGNLVKGSLVKEVSFIMITLCFFISACLAQEHLSSALRWSLKYYIISISLLQSISTDLTQGYFKASHYLRLLFTFLLSRVWHRGISQCVSLSQSFSLLYKICLLIRQHHA